MGHFTLDLDLALAKLRERQVENQLHYINRLLRSAVLLRAEKAEVECKHQKTRVCYPAVACRPEELSSLLHSVLSQSDPALRELATATNLACALDPTKIEVKVSDGRTCRVLKIVGHEAEVFEADAGPPGTTFQLERKAKSALALLGTEAPEYFEIFKRFRYCPIRLSINGKELKGGRGWGEKSGERVTVRKPSFFSLLGRGFYSNQHAIEARVRSDNPDLNGLFLSPSQAHSGIALSLASGSGQPTQPSPSNQGYGDFFLTIGFSVSKKRPSTASFVLWGETLQVFPVQLSVPGVEMVICAAGLDVDLSGDRLVENSRFEERWEQAKSIFNLIEIALRQAYPRAQGHGLVVQALYDNDHRWRGLVEPTAVAYTSPLTVI